MASIVKSVVNWGSTSRVKTPVPVQADLCEVCIIDYSSDLDEYLISLLPFEDLWQEAEIR